MVLTREGDNRFLFAEGRGKVAMLETRLIFDPATNLSLIEEGDRKATREVEHVNAVVEIVTGSPGMNTRSLTEAVREKIPSHNQDHASKAIATAKRLAHVHTVNGRNNAKLFHLGPTPLGKRSRCGSMSKPEYRSATSRRSGRRAVRASRYQALPAVTKGSLVTVRLVSLPLL
jgi:hypothetical protein